MRKRKKVVLLKSGNRLVVDPTTSKIRDLLQPLLTFTSKRALRGRELWIAETNELPTTEYTDWECFGDDHRGRIGCPFGFWKRIRNCLTEAGYQVVMRDLTPPPDPSVFEPQWERLKAFKLRHRQEEFLLAMLSHRCGRFDCPPGYGKSFMMGLAAVLLPKARFDIVTKRVAVAKERIYPELCRMLPSVGMVGGGMNRRGRRVMVYTADSYHHSTGDADFLLGDECHELAADNVAGKMGLSDNSRNFGLSASHDMRLDNKDLRVEGIFGPIIFQLDYAEAQKHKIVVPIEVYWTPVVMDFDPCEDEKDVEKKRLGLWTNDCRNDKIALDARRYGPDEQVLITCETLEHAVNLKFRLPEFQLVHKEDGMSPTDRKYYIKHGLLSDKEPYVDRARRAAMTKAFEAGKLKKVICTTVWNVGVSFNHLAVLIRADGGGSDINDTQIPGRVSRTGGDKKFVGKIHDYMDQFNRTFRSRACKRRRNYESHGWTQHLPGKPKKHTLAAELEREDEEYDGKF